jgi:tetratricopeptide (TPR) repeat protein
MRAAILGAAAAFELTRGHTGLAAERFEEAAGLAAQAGRGHVASRLWLQASRVRRQRGEFDRALAACEDAKAHADGDVALTEDIAIERATVEARLAQGDAVSSTAADSPRVRLARAEGALESGRPAAALVIYDALLADDPDALRTRLGRGRARLALNDLRGAREDLEVVLTLGPSARLAAATWSDLSRVAVAEGDPIAARGDLDRAIDLDEAYAEARYRRALLRAETGDRAGAEEDLRRAEAAGLAPDLVAATRRSIAARTASP